jgi:AcrR family transcriptional regulator
VTARRSGVRRAVLQAAAREISETGRLSIKAVAARVGVSRQAIHYHFGGAAGLVEALTVTGLTVPLARSAGTKERIVNAAERLLARPGGSETSIDAIAEEAGVTKGAICHYFDGRAGLLRAVARRISWAVAVQEAIDASAGQGDRDQLIAVTTALVDVMLNRADLLRNLAADAGRDPEMAKIVVDEITSRGAPLLFGWLEERIAAGKFRAVDPTLCVQALLGAAGLPLLGACACEHARAARGEICRHSGRSVCRPAIARPRARSEWASFVRLTFESGLHGGAVSRRCKPAEPSAADTPAGAVIPNVVTWLGPDGSRWRLT